MSLCIVFAFLHTMKKSPFLSVHMLATVYIYFAVFPSECVGRVSVRE